MTERFWHAQRSRVGANKAAKARWHFSNYQSVVVRNVARVVNVACRIVCGLDEVAILDGLDPPQGSFQFWKGDWFPEVLVVQYVRSKSMEARLASRSMEIVKSLTVVLGIFVGNIYWHKWIKIISKLTKFPQIGISLTEKNVFVWTGGFLNIFQSQNPGFSSFWR